MEMESIISKWFDHVEVEKGPWHKHQKRSHQTGPASGHTVAFAFAFNVPRLAGGAIQFAGFA